MGRIEVSRHVAADPASVALLLAEVASEHVDSGLSLAPPRRTGVGFTAPVEFAEPIGGVIAGEVTVEPAAGAGCDVVVRFVPTDRGASRGLERVGSTFLAALAARAKSRSFAA
jgi:hypothetical protein